ncbi:hypothetical protein Hanom_Chr16g01443821 [Helianthus anomalus]
MYRQTIFFGNFKIFVVYLTNDNVMDCFGIYIYIYVCVCFCFMKKIYCFCYYTCIQGKLVIL